MSSTPSSFSLFLEGKTHTKSKTVQAATSKTQLVKNNPARIGLVVSNNEATDIIISDLKEISTTLGLKVAKSGGFFSIIAGEDGTWPAQEWFIISSGTPTVQVTEILRN